VLPILQSNCMPCHDGQTRTSGFSVADLKSFVAGGARHGVAVTPGHPDQSVVIQMIRGDSKPAMPFGKKLAAAELGAIEDWIRTSTEEIYRAMPKEASYWACVKPAKPQPPDVHNAKWVRNPIDDFILARLEQAGLHPSEEARRRVLIRRLYSDLIGLAPRNNVNTTSTFGKIAGVLPARVMQLSMKLYF
jgi:Protein of unknown function (DUF1549)/Planctomycete cytochrome C